MGVVSTLFFEPRVESKREVFVVRDRQSIDNNNNNKKEDAFKNKKAEEWTGDMMKEDNNEASGVR